MVLSPNSSLGWWILQKSDRASVLVLSAVTHMPTSRQQKYHAILAVSDAVHCNRSCSALKPSLQCTETFPAVHCIFHHIALGQWAEHRGEGGETASSPPPSWIGDNSSRIIFSDSSHGSEPLLRQWRWISSHPRYLYVHRNYDLE